MGPLSSSHEQGQGAAKLHNRHYCRTAFTQPPAYLSFFIGVPILAFVGVVGLIPWFYALRFMVRSAKMDGWYVGSIHSVYQVIKWWITPQRLVFYFVIRIVKKCFVPVVQLAVIIVIKRNIIGKLSCTSFAIFVLLSIWRFKLRVWKMVSIPMF